MTEIPPVRGKSKTAISWVIKDKDGNIKEQGSEGLDEGGEKEK